MLLHIIVFLFPINEFQYWLVLLQSHLPFFAFLRVLYCTIRLTKDQNNILNKEKWSSKAMRVDLASRAQFSQRMFTCLISRAQFSKEDMFYIKHSHTEICSWIYLLPTPRTHQINQYLLHIILGTYVWWEFIQ